jgi:hypothetical protein
MARYLAQRKTSAEHTAAPSVGPTPAPAAPQRPQFGRKQL